MRGRFSTSFVQIQATDAQQVSRGMGVKVPFVLIFHGHSRFTGILERVTLFQKIQTPGN